MIVESEIRDQRPPSALPPGHRPLWAGGCHLSSDILEAWSRREELNTPSTDYDSAALTLSYTGADSKNHYATEPRPIAFGLKSPLIPLIFFPEDLP
jgi:hypothetical protein